VSVAIKKLEGVESIEVSLEKASAEIRLKPDNKITLPQIRRIIRSTGYPTKDARITAKGTIAERDGKPVLDLLNGSFLELSEKPKDPPAAAVEVTGVSRPGEKDAEVLTISSIK
jgi:copper chaperone CopZ